jgi:hypothetical protein
MLTRNSKRNKKQIVSTLICPGNVHPTTVFLSLNGFTFVSPTGKTISFHDDTLSLINECLENSEKGPIKDPLYTMLHDERHKYYPDTDWIVNKLKSDTDMMYVCPPCFKCLERLTKLYEQGSTPGRVFTCIEQGCFT